MASARYARDKIVGYLAHREFWEMWHGAWPPVVDGHAFAFPICFFPRIIHRDSGIFLGLSLRCRTSTIVMWMFVHSTMILLELFTNDLS